MRQLPGHWRAPIAKPRSLLEPTRFKFLNQAHDLAEIGWDSPGIPKLWRYNLHYFDDLNASSAADRHLWHAALISDWIRSNPPGRGSGWEPYPTSLRIVNWVKWLLAGNTPPEGMLESLGTQADWLTRRLEYHLLGNHLFANGKALVFAAFMLQGPMAERWLAKGTRLLCAQLQEQVLGDGGHFELSPMYHSIATEDILDLVNLDQAYQNPQPIVEPSLATKMLRWLAVMSHPDGGISFFNDGALDIAPSLGALRDYAERLDVSLPESPHPGMTHLADSGYIRLHVGDMVCLIDVARVGPDYLPGHAHADTLSFEVSLAGKRLLVNSGTSEYGGGPERLRQRGTAAHNTVVANGENSSEVWSGFRVARRAYPADLTIEREKEGWSIRCSHTGYARLPGKLKHIREWRLGGESLTVTDSFAGKFSLAEAYFHFSPDVRIKQEDGHSFRASFAEQTVSIAVQGDAVLADGTWHPQFGRTVPNQHLIVRSAGETISTRIGWRK